MSVDRRSFLRGLVSVGVAAPAIVHDIMRVKTMLWTPPRTNLFVGTTVYDGDAELGSAANPWRTIQQAIDYVTREIDLTTQPPVTVNIAEGIFHGFTLPADGPKFVTFRGIGPKTRIVQNPVTRRCAEFLAPYSVVELKDVELFVDPAIPAPARDGDYIVSLADHVWTIEGKKP